MKHQITLFVLLCCFLPACEEDAQSSQAATHIENAEPTDKADPQPEYKSPLRPNEKLVLGKSYTDTVKYLSFNDEGDEWMFLVAKNENQVGLIYNEEPAHKFIRGAEIEITWKMDSIRYAGDDEFLDFTAFLVAAKKIKPLRLTDKKVKVLWRADKYDEALKTEINTIVLDTAYMKAISAPEKAALAYVATFVGNECEWDGNPNEDRTNLKCKIIWALNLGYQCADEHLDYLKFWFRNSEKVLSEFANCRTTPDGATVQDTFDEINLEVSGNEIIVAFKASGINLRAGETWTWTEKNYFEFKENELHLIKKELSPIERESFEIEEN